MAPARSGLRAVRTDDVEDEPRSHFRHGLLTVAAAVVTAWTIGTADRVEGRFCGFMPIAANAWGR